MRRWIYVGPASRRDILTHFDGRMFDAAWEDLSFRDGSAPPMNVSVLRGISFAGAQLALGIAADGSFHMLNWMRPL